MNDPPFDQRQLELATAAKLPADAPLAAETAELREAWLSLTQAVSRTSAESDTASFAARMARELTAAPVVGPSRGHRNLAVVCGALGAVAAAALLAVGIWLSQPSQAPEVAAVESAPANLAEPADDLADDFVAWDDPLDARIAEVQDQLADFASDDPRLDASLSALDQQLAELAYDLDAGSL